MAFRGIRFLDWLYSLIFWRFGSLDFEKSGEPFLRFFIDCIHCNFEALPLALDRSKSGHKLEFNTRIVCFLCWSNAETCVFFSEQRLTADARSRLAVAVVAAAHAPVAARCQRGTQHAEPVRPAGSDRSQRRPRLRSLRRVQPPRHRTHRWSLHWSVLLPNLSYEYEKMGKFLNKNWTIRSRNWSQIVFCYPWYCKQIISKNATKILLCST